LKISLLAVTGANGGFYPVYTINLARRTGYMLAGRASSMFTRRLLCFIPRLHDRANIELAGRAMVISMLIMRAGGL